MSGTQKLPTAYSYAFFPLKISQYSHFYKLNICKIIDRSVFLSLLKIFYSPFQVKQSKLCHYIDWSSSIFQFIIMWTFQTSNKSNFAMSFWMIRWNLAAIKQLAEMEYFHSSLPMKIASNWCCQSLGFQPDFTSRRNCFTQSY